MRKKKATWYDLRHEILGLKGAILGARAGLYHGEKVTIEMLVILQEIAIRIHDIADFLEQLNKGGKT